MLPVVVNVVPSLKLGVLVNLISKTHENAPSSTLTEDHGELNAASHDSQEGLQGQSDDEELQQALRSSKESHAAHLRELEKSQAEEDVVLKYVQKLSAFEEAQKETHNDHGPGN